MTHPLSFAIRLAKLASGSDNWSVYRRAAIRRTGRRGQGPLGVAIEQSRRRPADIQSAMGPIAVGHGLQSPGQPGSIRCHLAMSAVPCYLPAAAPASAAMNDSNVSGTVSSRLSGDRQQTLQRRRARCLVVARGRGRTSAPQGAKSRLEGGLATERPSRIECPKYSTFLRAKPWTSPTWAPSFVSGARRWD